MPPRLVRPTPALRDAFLDMVRDWPEEERRHLWAGACDDFAGYVQFLLNDAMPEHVNRGWVPCSHFWLVTDQGRVVGTSRLRHSLVPHLEREGGHIGYDVRPSERGRGYGTRLLALTLCEARWMGLSRVLVTCDEDNPASRRVIEKNGGKLASRGISERTGKPILRYWIDLSDGQKRSEGSTGRCRDVLPVE